VRQQNLDVLAETTDLTEFLFGSERGNLAVVRPVLLDIQRGRCFYCQREVATASAHVDRFVAWARYPVDLGHNFVLADARCNNYKRDRLPAYEHLAGWVERNAIFGDQIRVALEEHGIVTEVAASRIAEWAYAQTEATKGLTWVQGDVRCRWIKVGGRSCSIVVRSAVIARDGLCRSQPGWLNCSMSGYRVIQDQSGQSTCMT
jgi:hypothetical protein